MIRAFVAIIAGICFLGALSDLAMAWMIWFAHEPVSFRQVAEASFSSRGWSNFLTAYIVWQIREKL